MLNYNWELVSGDPETLQLANQLRATQGEDPLTIEDAKNLKVHGDNKNY